MYKDKNAFIDFKKEVLNNNRFFLSKESEDFILEFEKQLESKVKESPKFSEFYRAQIGYSTRKEYQSGIYIEDIETAFPPQRMSPLKDAAKEGRINPKGIPYLYISDDKDTAIAETRSWFGQKVSLGNFKLCDNLKLIDLSVTDKKRYIINLKNKKIASGVINDLIWAQINYSFSEPVVNSDFSADYIPTQILSESIKKQGYDGIIFNSFVGSGLNYVLFDLDAAILTSCSLHQVSEYSIQSEQVENPYIRTFTNNPVFYYGNSERQSFESLIENFSSDDLNSYQTSTIPLLEYWKKKENSEFFINKITSDSIDDVKVMFEYPTPSYKRNRPSMSDIMIINNHYKIAVEGKYTEVKEQYETVEKWNNNTQNRNNVLKHWLSLLEPYLERVLSIEDIQSIPYQFLHRIASSCYNSNTGVTVYQIFYDNQTKQKAEVFLKILEASISILKPNLNLRIIFWLVEIKDILHKDKLTILN